MEKLEKMLPWKKGNKFLAGKLKCTEQEVAEMIKELTVEEELPDLGESTYSLNLEKEEIKVSKIWSFAPQPEDVIKEHRIDTNKWKLSQIWIKQTTKGYLTSAAFAPKKVTDVDVPSLEKLITNYKSSHKLLQKTDLLLNTGSERKHMVFIDLTDFHLDRKELEGKTLDEKVKEYEKLVVELCKKSYSAGFIEEIVFIVGSDFFNTDNIQGNTTAGTPQTSIGTWDQVYEIGFDIYASAITHLKQFCEKLKVILIQGNHDRTKSFYLAHALSKYFDKDKYISFDIETKPRKVHKFGTTFIGLHHGNCKIDDLPITFAKEFPKIWGQCTNHEVKVGDKHYFLEKEIKGVRIKQIPALCGPDQWSNDNNYIGNIKAGIATVYDKEWGKVSEHEVRL